jgi:tetratricopeptide (TPR) repeat protein
VERAEKWCELGGGIPAALEVVLAGRASGDTLAEVRGRKLLARTLPPKSGELMEAGARLLESFKSPGDSMPDVNASDPYAQTSLLLASLEHFTPGSAPQNREMALLELSDSVASGSETLIEMAAWSALARSELAKARQLFLQAIDKSGSDVTRSALEGLLEIETLESDGKVSREWARWAERLATLLADSSPEDAAVEWEKIGLVYWDRLGDQNRGERALEKAFVLDPTRRVAFDRVFRAVRGRKEDDHLLEIAKRRLEVSDSPEEQAKLHWETARVLRQKGDRDGALAALEAVTTIEPDHIGALALSAEIYVGRGEFARAADAFARLSHQPVPPPQILAAALGAADLYEFKLNEPAKAVDVLVAAEKAGISDTALIERVVRPAYAAENWDVAVVHLTQLASIRPTKEARIEAIRSAVTIYREKLAALPSALPLIVQWLRDAPGDVDAIELLLDNAFDRRIVQPQIAKALPRLVQDLARDPLVEDRLRMTAKVAYFLGDQPRELLASSSLVALSLAESFEHDREKLLASQLAPWPSMALDPQALKRLASPDEPQVITQLLRILGPATAQALGPTLELLGVTKRDKIDVRAQNTLRNEIAAWAGAFGVTEFDFYISPKDSDILAGIPGEPHSLVVGHKWQSPLTLVQRARLARELCALERGASMALVRDDTAVAALIAAACMLMNVSINVPNYSVLAETQKQLGKTISRKIRRDLTEVAEMVGRGIASGYDLRAYKGHLMLSLDRAAIVATGSPTAAVTDLGPGTSIASHPRAAAMLRFVWSDDFLDLQKLLGLGMGK